jgi:hypothetical protein
LVFPSRQQPPRDLDGHQHDNQPGRRGKHDPSRPEVDHQPRRQQQLQQHHHRHRLDPADPSQPFSSAIR